MHNMNINRHNYESFFLLYVDRELDAAGREAVEDFVAQNPDLERELSLLQQLVFPPEKSVIFAGKEHLLKGDNKGIHAGNYEEFFILYADDELGVDEKRAVEAFVYHQPQYQEALELLQAIRMAPDTSVVFDDKQSLYRRKENDDKVVPFRWWPVAAAAIMLLLLGLWWMAREKPAGPGPIAGRPKNDTPVTQPATSPAATKDTGQDIQPPAVTAPEAPIARATQQEENNVPANPSSGRQPALALKTNNNTRPTPVNPGIAQQTPPDNDYVNTTAVLPDRPQNALAIKGMNARPALIAQVVTINRPDNIVPDASWDQDDHSNNDRIAIMNTSVKKTALRGFLRKASRVIAKKTNSGDDDDDNQKHVLIGGFAIPVK
jgi:hypothetical protein